MHKDRKKILLRKLGLIGFKGILFFGKHLFRSLEVSYFVGKFLGLFFYFLGGRYRKICLTNIAIAFPEKSLREQQKIAQEFFIFLVQMLTETIYLYHNFSPVIRNISIEGKQHLDKALSKGKGVILLTGHIGYFLVMAYKLINEGYSLTGWFRPMSDREFFNYFISLGKEIKMKPVVTYPVRTCLLESAKALEKNRLLLTLIDQNDVAGTVWIRFFGKLAATATGPVTLALQTGAALVPIYIHRAGKGKHVIRIFPEEELTVKENRKETMLYNMTKFSRKVEGWIKEFPEQWWWIHRRWKKQPNEQDWKKQFKIESEENINCKNVNI